MVVLARLDIEGELTPGGVIATKFRQSHAVFGGCGLSHEGTHEGVEPRVPGLLNIDVVMQKLLDRLVALGRFDPYIEVQTGWHRTRLARGSSSARSRTVDANSLYSNT